MGETNRRVWSVVGGLIIVITLALMTRTLADPEPTNLGVKDGHLAPCPDTPNCVSTQCEDGDHSMKPLALSASAETTVEAIATVLRGTRGIKIVERSNDYVHAVATSRLLGFVDDVEFYVDQQNEVIHFRSASRFGYSDLGVNRKRMVRFRQEFEREMHSRPGRF